MKKKIIQFLGFLIVFLTVASFFYLVYYLCGGIFERNIFVGLIFMVSFLWSVYLSNKSIKEAEKSIKR